MGSTHLRLLARTAARLLILVPLAGATYWVSPFTARQAIDQALGGASQLVMDEALSAGRDSGSAAPTPNEAYDFAQANALLLQYHARSLHEVFPASLR
jgi:hypothetical protein